MYLTGCEQSDRRHDQPKDTGEYQAVMAVALYGRAMNDDRPPDADLRRLPPSSETEAADDRRVEATLSGPAPAIAILSIAARNRMVRPNSAGAQIGEPIARGTLSQLRCEKFQRGLLSVGRLEAFLLGRGGRY